jgi:periplasmic protein TonB
MRAANSNSDHPLENKVLQEAATQQNSAKNKCLPLTALTDCLVDADTAATARFGRGRRNALGASALVQFTAICVLLIWPLFATGSRLIARPATVIPPYGRIPHADHPPTQQQSTPSRALGIHVTIAGPQFRPPNKIPPQIYEGIDRRRPLIDPPPFGSADPRHSGPIGLLDIPGASSNTPLPPIAISRAPKPREPLKVSEGVVLASLIHRVEPIYPSIARQIHLEGVVELRAIIARDGTVQQLQEVSGNPILVRAAREAVLQWRFRPTLLNGEPVEVDTFFNVRFHLAQ